MNMDYQALAIKAGLMYEEEEGSGITYWTTGDAELALETFAKLVVSEQLFGDTK